jgi:hypothetical protein
MQLAEITSCHSLHLNVYKIQRSYEKAWPLSMWVCLGMSACHINGLSCSGKKMPYSIVSFMIGWTHKILRRFILSRDRTHTFRQILGSTSVGPTFLGRGLNNHIYGEVKETNCTCSHSRSCSVLSATAPTMPKSYSRFRMSVFLNFFSSGCASCTKSLPFVMY